MIIGIDMGGTNLDGVVIDQGKLVRQVKLPINQSDYFSTIWQAINQLTEGLDTAQIERIHLSTTINTNAIIENKIAPVGLILQPGPGIQWSTNRWGKHVATISGSIDHRGKVVQAPDSVELSRIQTDFSDAAIDSLAIVTKFSPRNPKVEQLISERFQTQFSQITLGHSFSGKLNFPRRVETAYLNAAVAKSFLTFSQTISQALHDAGLAAPVYLLKGDGGTISLREAERRPVETIFSGPAASFMGLSALESLQNQDWILLDIGGTTTDIFFLVDGVPVFEPVGIEIDQRKTLVRAIFSLSIGLGGDSFVRFEDGELRIGPMRKGAAVAFGGQYVTPTDALVYLNKLTGEDLESSRKALELLADSQSMEPVDLARRIVKTLAKNIKETIDATLKRFQDSPVYTIKELLRDRTIVPTGMAVIGGPAEALASYLEEEFQLPVKVPSNSQIANAIGAALAKPTMEINLLADTERNILSVPELSIYQSLDQTITLNLAEAMAVHYLQSALQDRGIEDHESVEIVESSSFNMVQGWKSYKNIRVKAQIKPGLLYTFREGDDNEG